MAARDENDRLKDGTLPDDPTADSEEMSGSKGATVHKFPKLNKEQKRQKELLQSLVTTNKYIRANWSNNGKPLPRKGKPSDKSLESYEWSLAVRLVQAGIDEEEVLVQELCNRPDGSVQSGKCDVADVRDIVTEAISLVKIQNSSFRPDHVSMTNSNPRTFEFTVGNKKFTVSSSQLADPKKYALCHLDATGHLPDIPTKAGDEWTTLVNSWLGDAEIVELPLEANLGYQLKRLTIDLLELMPKGEFVPDLKSGMKIPYGDRFAFDQTELRRRVNRALDRHEEAKRNDYCNLLRELGCESSTLVLPVDTKGSEKKKCRVWLTPEVWPYLGDFEPEPERQLELDLGPDSTNPSPLRPDAEDAQPSPPPDAGETEMPTCQLEDSQDENGTEHTRV